MDELDVIRINMAVESLQKAVVYLNETDANVVREMIDTHIEVVNRYNRRNLTVINPTKKELGVVGSSLKKRVLSVYNDPAQKTWIKWLCDKTRLSKELVDAKILLARQHGSWYRMNKLEIELNEHLLQQMFMEFQTQNSKQLNKLNYETSKQ